METTNYAVIKDLAARIARGYNPLYGEARSVNVFRDGKTVNITYTITPVNVAAAFEFNARRSH